MRVEDCVRQLQGVVDRIVAESGNPRNFDSVRWLSEWIEKPNPALGGRLPREMFEEAGGFERVRTLLLRMQSGAYS
ncbi:MbcA/ParS/Xre antitoxin family protein [Ramlibacter sp.]|uniref:MbcA/ParS/Xre antitoxin family protein n=1 Tax=Ramlibacter sp. TaxID=1917967 RepID=UPI003418006D